MKRLTLPLLSSLALSLSITACVASDPSLDALDAEDFAGSGDDDGNDEDEPLDPETMDEPVELPPSADDLWSEVDPDLIIDGFIHDSDRDVAVFGAGTCTGTLVRNNVVLTAKHCVSTDGTIEGPELGPASVTVQQDGPGATMGATRSVTNIVRMGNRDIAMLRLSSGMSIDGQTYGQSTQILATSQEDVVGTNVLCQGYGRNTCEGGAGTLRGGLVAVDDNVGGMLQYAPINGYDWIQWKGDSGSSCRKDVFIDPNLNKLLGVASTGTCGVQVNETGPELYRDWAVDQMNAWAGGTFLDTFWWPYLYEVDVPAGMLQGPPNWQVSGGVLTENSNAYTNTTHYEGTRYVNAHQVASDAIVRVTVTSADNDAAGLVMRYRDPTHYYRLSFDEQRNYARIVRRSGNSWTVIDEDLSFNIDWSTSPEIGFYAWGPLIAGLVNDEVVLIGVDDDNGYTAGRAGMYTWGLTGATFDNFEIERF